MPIKDEKKKKEAQQGRTQRELESVQGRGRL